LPPPPPPASRKTATGVRKTATGARKTATGVRKTATGAQQIAPDGDVQRLVRLDGLAVRRRRHDRGWSARDLVVAIQDACFNASGLRRTLTPNQIQAVEERQERISYSDLLLLADGLACDPSDLIAEGEMSSARTGRRLH